MSQKKATSGDKKPPKKGQVLREDGRPVVDYNEIIGTSGAITPSSIKDWIERNAKAVDFLFEEVASSLKEIERYRKAERKAKENREASQSGQAFVAKKTYAQEMQGDRALAKYYKAQVSFIVFIFLLKKELDTQGRINPSRYKASKKHRLFDLVTQASFDRSSGFSFFDGFHESSIADAIGHLNFHRANIQEKIDKLIKGEEGILSWGNTAQNFKHILDDDKSRYDREIPFAEAKQKEMRAKREKEDRAYAEKLRKEEQADPPPTTKRKKPTTLDMMRGATKRPRMTVSQVLKAIGITWSDEEAKSILESVFGKGQDIDTQRRRNAISSLLRRHTNAEESDISDEKIEEITDYLDKEIGEILSAIDPLKREATNARLRLAGREAMRRHTHTTNLHAYIIGEMIRHLARDAYLSTRTWAIPDYSEKKREDSLVEKSEEYRPLPFYEDSEEAKVSIIPRTQSYPEKVIISLQESGRFIDKRTPFLLSSDKFNRSKPDAPHMMRADEFVKQNIRQIDYIEARQVGGHQAHPLDKLGVKPSPMYEIFMRGSDSQPFLTEGLRFKSPSSARLFYKLLLHEWSVDQALASDLYIPLADPKELRAGVLDRYPHLVERYRSPLAYFGYAREAIKRRLDQMAKKRPVLPFYHGFSYLTPYSDPLPNLTLDEICAATNAVAMWANYQEGGKPPYKQRNIIAFHYNENERFFYDLCELGTGIHINQLREMYGRSHGKGHDDINIILNAAYRIPLVHPSARASYALERLERVGLSRADINPSNPFARKTMLVDESQEYAFDHWPMKLDVLYDEKVERFFKEAADIYLSGDYRGETYKSPFSGVEQRFSKKDAISLFGGITGAAEALQKFKMALYVPLISGFCPISEKEKEKKAQARKKIREALNLLGAKNFYEMPQDRSELLDTLTEEILSMAKETDARGKLYRLLKRHGDNEYDALFKIKGIFRQHFGFRYDL